MLLTFLIAAAVVSLSGRVSARGSLDFRLRESSKRAAITESSPTRLTNNVLQLQRVNASSQSAEYLRAVRAGSQVNGIYSRLETGNTSILGVDSGSVFLAPITVGNQSFTAVVDTGSSDTWLVQTGFTCVNSAGTTQNESSCLFGAPYNISNTANVIGNENFNISYADSEFMYGSMMLEDITIANISVSQQEMGLVTYASWNGDGISSGLIGLAYPALTNAYPGTNPTDDEADDWIEYSPLFTTMYTRNLTAPVFSLALQRSSVPNSATSDGGLLAFGGIPASIPHDPVFVNTSISTVGVVDGNDNPEYDFYSIDITGWAYSNDSSAIFDVDGTGTNPRYTPLNTAATAAVILDSGTSLIYAPPTVVGDLAALYAPAATFDAASQLYTVPCAATAPVFGVVVAAKVLYVNPADLIIRAASDLCIMGVQSSGAGHMILGDVFLRNVLVVFDVGAAEMRFAAREFSEV